MRFIAQKFGAVDVVLDGNAFLECDFSGSRLRFDAVAAVLIEDCRISDASAPPELHLGGKAERIVWDLGVEYRFYSSIAVDCALHFVEGRTPELLGKWDNSQRNLFYCLRSLHALVPKLLHGLIAFVRAEPQRVVPEPVRATCTSPACRHLAFVRSPLPAGAIRSSATFNFVQCPRCGAPCRLENHGVDETGRVWREFAEQILRSPGVTSAHVYQLHRVIEDAPRSNPAVVAERISSISKIFGPIAEALAGLTDRAEFLRRVAILGALAAAITLSSHNEPSSEESSSQSAKARLVTEEPMAGLALASRLPSDGDALRQMEDDLLQHCKRVADDPATPLEEIAAAWSTCRTIAADRASARKSIESGSEGFFSRMLTAILSVEALSGLFWTFAGDIFKGALKRRLQSADSPA